MTKVQGKQMPMSKRIAVIAMILAVTVLAYLLWRPGRMSEEQVPAELATVAFGFGNLVIGLACFVLAAVVYGLVYLTNGLVFDFKQRVWEDHKKIIYLAQIAVMTLLTVGTVFLLARSPTETEPDTMPLPTRAPLVFLGCLVFYQFLLFYLCLWTPVLLRVIRRRLASKGLAEEELARGMYMGISNPAKSTFKKISSVEEDVGMLWITKDAITYMGDTDEFRVEPRHLLEVTRKADTGSISALVGNVPVIIRFALDGSPERTVRFHPENYWTLTQLKHASNALCAAIERWVSDNQPAPAGPVSSG